MPTRQLMRIALAWLLACCMTPVLAQQAYPQFVENRALLLAGDFAALESRYPAAIAPATGGSFAESLSFFFFEQMEIGRFLDNWPQEEKAARAWLESSPTSVPAALTLAYGLWRRAHRLDAAGDWVRGEAALREQEGLLLATKQKAAKEIVWHMMYVSWGSKQGWPPERIMDAVEAGLDAHPASVNFHVVAGAALAPDSRGSAQPLEWLARQAAARRAPPDAAATYASVRLWTSRFIASVYRQPFEAGLIEWKMMNEGMTELYRRTAGVGTLNEHGALACRAGDKETTAALLHRIGTAPLRDLWNRWGDASHYEKCKAWAEQGTVKS